MMAPGQGQQQQAMGMTPSVVPAPTAGVPGAGMRMMGQSGAPQGAVPAMQQQGMYMQQQPMQNMQTGAQMGETRLVAFDDLCVITDLLSILTLDLQVPWACLLQEDIPNRLPSHSISST